jgi:hypothetical protein
VNALKQIDMKRIRRAETVTFSILGEERKAERAQKRGKEDQEGPDNPQYGTGMQ